MALRYPRVHTQLCSEWRGLGDHEVSEAGGVLAPELRGQTSRERSTSWGPSRPAGAFRSDGPSSPAALPLQLTASEEEFLRTYAGVVNSQLSQLPQHSIDQGE